MKDETRRWVELADADLAAAKVLLKEGILALSVFHCQQAIEKLLKAIWIETRGEPSPRTHNLVDLAREMALPLGEWEQFLGRLSDQAVASRYAGAEGYSQADAQEYHRRTLELCARLRQHLK